MVGTRRYRCLSAVILAAIGLFNGDPAGAADPGMSGQAGLVHMPSARIAPDGTLRVGISDVDPYFTLWSSIVFFPRLELAARYTAIDGVAGFADGTGFGDYKDKAFDAKLLLIRESTLLPDIAVGVQDFTGTRVFSARYVALSKQFGGTDLTAGYGADRIDGLFGGIRYRPAWHRRLGLVIEYDAHDYRNDFRAAASGAIHRRGGATYGIEYHYGWLGTQLSWQDGELGVNAYVSIPLSRQEFIPKLDEPPPRTEFAPPVVAPGRSETARRLDETVRALHEQGFRNIRIRLAGNALEASVTHPRITLISRAVGRAARTLLGLRPDNIDRLVITYTQDDLALQTYRFNDLELLRDYFTGRLTGQRLEDIVDVTAARPGDGAGGKSPSTRNAPERDASFRANYGDDGHIVSFTHEGHALSSLQLIPFNLRFFFNDPSGAFHYDTFALAVYRKHLAHGLFFDTAARLTLFEDVSDVTQASNSLLPHVRTDVAEYHRDGDRLRLEKLLLNRYLHPYQRLYGRLSAGYYEEMFGGFGGQLLYLPAQRSWAFDITADWLKQRAPGEAFEFRDYSVVSALAAVHYRWPDTGLTTTARVGRFLAKDEGVRVEMKRRFRSGVEIGAWYTVTDGDDITTPGSPDDPYRDKGVFVTVPLSSMLTSDTRQTSSLSLVPWTRDVGQMVRSPDDLYRRMERPLMLDNPRYFPFLDFDQ